jgi:small-conductance mechanosensitive channel
MKQSLVERLRDSQREFPETDYGAEAGEAADEIEQQAATIERLREALDRARRKLGQWSAYFRAVGRPLDADDLASTGSREGVA